MSVIGVDVLYLIYMVWGSNIGVGKILIFVGVFVYKIYFVLLLNWILVFVFLLWDLVVNFFMNFIFFMFDVVGWFYV